MASPGSMRLNSTHFMRFPCCSSMDPFDYIVYFGGLSGNQVLVDHLENSNTKVKSGLVCFFFYLWQITVMSDKKFACRTNFKLYQTFCLVKIFLSVIAWSNQLNSWLVWLNDVCTFISIHISVIDFMNWYMGHKKNPKYLHNSRSYFVSGNLDFGMENSWNFFLRLLWEPCFTCCVV